MKCDAFGNFEETTVGEKWWELQGSNLRHPPCKGGALPAELSSHSKENGIYARF